jgi:hypothetical protein
MEFKRLRRCSTPAHCALLPPGSQNISPAPSPTPSHCSSGFESSVEPFFNGWENQTVLSPPESTEQYPEGLPMNFGYFNTGPSSSQHTSHGHHRSESSSSTLSWTSSFSSADFDAGSLMDQASYNQGAISPEITTVVIPNASRTAPLVNSNPSKPSR